MPPPGFPGGPPSPAPAKKRRLVMLLAAGGVVVVVLLATLAVVVARNMSDAPSGPVAAEQCIDERLDLSDKPQVMQTVPAARRVSCKSDEAQGRVVKVLGSGEGVFGGSTFMSGGCPDDSDGGARVRVAPKDTRYWDVCVRNLKGPHPGDPGVGGGQFAAGDCISNSIAFNREVPCSSANWYGKVIARVQAEAQCPRPRTMETAKITGAAGSGRSILCLGAGGKVLAPGDCIEDPSFSFQGPEKAQCGTDKAVAKVTGRVSTQRECPSGSDKYMEAKGAYLPVLCLKQLKPTLKEQLGGLGRT